MVKALFYKYKYIGLALVLVLIFLWASQHYNEDVVYLNEKKYRVASHTEQEIVLQASDRKIVVQIDGQNRTVIINGVKYEISWTDNVNFPYLVTYPTGQQLKVANGANYAFTMEEELYIPHPKVVTSGGTVISNSPQYEYLPFYPTNLVNVAYEQFYEQQGLWSGFIFSLILTSFGIALFLSEKLQLLLFSLRYGLDVVDPEPSDFYYLSTKVSGVIIAVVGIVFFLMTL